MREDEQSIEEVRDLWQEAEVVLNELGVPEADKVATWLAELDSPEMGEIEVKERKANS
jgi:hypothetical protein